MIHFKGELSDGHVHMTAGEYCEHKVDERYEKDLTILRKLANNPILDQEVRNAVWSAIWCYQDKIMWRDNYIRVRQENSRLWKIIEKRGINHGTDS